jgi:hypothetical protein
MQADRSECVFGVSYLSLTNSINALRMTCADTMAVSDCSGYVSERLLCERQSDR